MYWHGYPETIAEYRRLSLRDRWLANTELDAIITHVNNEGGGQPKDQR